MSNVRSAVLRCHAALRQGQRSATVERATTGPGQPRNSLTIISDINPRLHLRKISVEITQMPETRSTEPLVWIDCEMTGLDPTRETIMSLACFITDHNLNLLDDKGYEAIVHHDQERMDAMGPWCQDHHGASGLTQACLSSTTTAEQAADGLMAYILRYAPERRRALLAGNTVHADRSFLVREPWTKITNHLHHRLLDVSAIKEAARRWAPEDVLKKSPQKAGKHEARADILESIAEAKFYRETFFTGNNATREA